MKKVLFALVGIALVILAVYVFKFVDSGYIPDSMDCGSGMNGYGYCYDDEGPWIMGLLKALGVFFSAVFGIVLIGVACLKDRTPVAQ